MIKELLDLIGIPLLVIACCDNSEFLVMVILNSPGGVFAV